MCVYAQLPRIGMFRGSMGGMARDGNSSGKSGKPIRWSMSLSWCIGFFLPFKTRKWKLEAFREPCEMPDCMFSKKCFVWTSTWAWPPSKSSLRHFLLFFYCNIFCFFYCLPFQLKETQSFLWTEWEHNISFLWSKKIIVCALCLFKSLLWILIFCYFKKNRTNLYTPVFQKKMHDPFLLSCFTLNPFLFHFLFFNLFFELLCRNLVLLFVYLLFPFFCVSLFSSLFSRVFSFVCCLHTFSEHRFFSESPSFKCVFS